MLGVFLVQSRRLLRGQAAWCVPLALGLLIISRGTASSTFGLRTSCVAPVEVVISRSVGGHSNRQAVFNRMARRTTTLTRMWSAARRQCAGASRWKVIAPTDIVSLALGLSPPLVWRGGTDVSVGRGDTTRLHHAIFTVMFLRRLLANGQLGRLVSGSSLSFLYRSALSGPCLAGRPTWRPCDFVRFDRHSARVQGVPCMSLGLVPYLARSAFEPVE